MGATLHFCYIDESGDSQAIKSASDDKQPMLVIGGLIVDATKISNITHDFINLKRKYYPRKFPATLPYLSILLTEIKGSDIRTDIRKNPPQSAIVQHHFHFLDDVIALCKRYDVKIVGRVWIKRFGQPINDKAVYTISTQNIGKRFQSFLSANASRGVIIADFRDPARNQYVAHSIFTQKHKSSNGGDEFPLIEETTVFGMSNNHACLQITDLICSALISPIAGRVVCAPYFSNVHTHSNYDAIWKRYSRRLRQLQFHCKINQSMYWGISVDDPHGSKRSIFTP